MQINIDKKAQNLIARLKQEHGEGIFFYQSFGCCDGSVIICYSKDDFKLGQNDVCLGKSEFIELYSHRTQVPLYENAVLNVSAKEGLGNEYSLECGSGETFVFDLKK